MFRFHMKKSWKAQLVSNKISTTSSRRPKPIDVAHPSRKMLWFFGLYTGKVIQRHPFQQISRSTIVLLIAILPFLMFMKLFLNNRSGVLEGWNMVLVHSFLFIKMLMYSWSKKIPAVEVLLESEILNYRTEAQDRFVARAIRNLKIYAGLIWFICWAFSISIAAFVPENVDSLFMPIWTPVDLSPIFWHAYEVVSFNLSAHIFAAVDNSVLAIVANTAAQFQILRDNLRSSCERNPDEDHAEQERRIQNRLGNCIRHHNAVLDYFSKMEESISIILFCQILFSTLGICLSGFQFLLVPVRSFRFFSASVYLLVFLTQVISLCMFAEDIVAQSSGIVKSCFAAEWYECSISTRKMFLIIMERGKEPTALKAGPIFTLSLRTFVMILRTAYSYYAVLHNIYKK